MSSSRNGAGAIVDDYTFPFATNDYWVVSDATSDIQSLEIIAPFIAIDDLQFYGTTVPEPSSILLLLGGLTSAAYARLRRS